MKIVGLSELLTLPVGTLFREYRNQVFGVLAVFEGPAKENETAIDYHFEDFYYPSFIGNTSPLERHYTLKIMEDFGKSALVVFGKIISSRGLTPKHQLFAVFERPDVEQYIAHLNAQLLRGYCVGSETRNAVDAGLEPVTPQ
ncbi:MAG: hypothetical protein JWP58_3126 [Hymenobacter sp.]|nr:hypothetical protein [Hymenobacter sp.]